MALPQRSSCQLPGEKLSLPRNKNGTSSGGFPHHSLSASEERHLRSSARSIAQEQANLQGEAPDHPDSSKPEIPHLLEACGI